MFEFLKRKKKKKSYEMQTVRLNDLLNFLGIDENSDRLQEVTYYTCLKVLSEGLSKLPLALQRVSEDGGIIDMISSPLWQTAKVRPNPYMSPSTFWAVMENNRNHFGNGYAMILRDEKSGSVTLWPMEPSCIRIEIEQGKDLSELTDITYVYTSPNNGQSFRLRSDEVLHVKTSTVFFGLVGLSVQDKLKMSLDGASMSQEMLNKLYKNNFVPKAAVQFDTASMVNEEYESAYLKTLQNYADGKGEGGSSFIPLSPGTNIVPLNIKLTDGQFLELRKYTALQIAAAFGIKPNHLNDYERSSYANSETQQLAFYTDTMLYILKQYEEELNFKLLSQAQREQGYRFKFNIAAVLRGDTKSQLESLSMGVSNGVYTPNEARRNLDLPALPGGDRIYFNGSNIAVEDAGIQYREQEQSDNEKALIRLAESIEKAVECGIISVRKYDPGQPRGDNGRWIDAGGGSGSSGGGASGSIDSPKKRLQKMIDDGDVTLELNETIQNRHYKGTNEYNSFLAIGVEKSYFTVPQSELQDFLYKNATKGEVYISSAGDAKERFNFGKVVAFDTMLQKETTWLTAIYSKKKNAFFAIFTYARGGISMKLLEYLWKKVNIKCKDGKEYHNCYVVAYDDKYDNVDQNEDSIGIKHDKKDNYGVEIFESEIEFIEIVD